jgi:tetrapyrrole methylase family protein/MazG family protein
MKKVLKYNDIFGICIGEGRKYAKFCVQRALWGSRFQKDLACSVDEVPVGREQTHSSIRRNLLEEAYEVCGAIDEESPSHLQEELGDLLMQILFHARIEEEAGHFDLDDVADAACKKLILRHPHVFGNVTVSDSAEYFKIGMIKRLEKSRIRGRRYERCSEALPLCGDGKVQKKRARLVLI